MPTPPTRPRSRRGSKPSLLTLARQNPNVAMLAVIAVVVIGFSFFKFLTAGNGHGPANDQPARAFQDPGVPQLVDRDHLLAPRLPDEPYRRLSAISAGLGRRALAGRMTPRYLRAAGMSRGSIETTLAGLKPLVKEIHGLKISQQTGYHLAQLNGRDALIVADLLIVDPSGRRLSAPVSGQIRLEYTAGASWNRVKLQNITLSFGG